MQTTYYLSGYQQANGDVIGAGQTIYTPPSRDVLNRIGDRIDHGICPPGSSRLFPWLSEHQLLLQCPCFQTVAEPSAYTSPRLFHS